MFHGYGTKVFSGERMIIVATLGFEEKFALRALVRREIKKGDKMVVLLPAKGDPKGESAFFRLKEVKEKAFPDLEIERVEVDVRDFCGAVCFLRNILKELSLKDRIVLNVSGGQRILILELLAAASSLKLKNAEIEIETEDSSFYSTVPLEIMFPTELDALDVELLRTVAEGSGMKLKDLTEMFDIPKATLWRKLSRLVEMRLLEKKNDKYYLSDLGRSRL